MYEIKELEENWKKYKRKQLRPIIMLVTLVVVIVIAIFTIEESPISLSSIKNYFKNDNITRVDTNDKSQMLIDGALGLLDSSDKGFISVNNQSKTNTIVDIPVLDGKTKVHLDIVETTSISAYKDVERRFLQTHNIDDSLFLAKSYYKKEKYKKALYWALESNKIDADMEESIFIFVKSKFKLGNKEEAISILVTYIKKSDSEEGKNLLYQLKNNKI